jgi:hypothetical protein
MTNEKTAKLIFALGLDDPEHKARAKQMLAKFASRRLELAKVAKTPTLRIKNIVDEEEHRGWLGHVEKIVKKHRDVHGIKNKEIPYPLSSATKLTAAKIFGKNYKKELEEMVKQMKNDNKVINGAVKAIKRK